MGQGSAMNRPSDPLEGLNQIEKDSAKLWIGDGTRTDKNIRVSKANHGAFELIQSSYSKLIGKNQTQDQTMTYLLSVYENVPYIEESS